MALVKNIPDKAVEFIDYLRKNPEFFNKHPEILSEIKIPHRIDSKVSSLLEYQVSRLRTEIKEKQNNLDFLVQHTHRKRKLADCMHELSLKLLECERPEELYANISKALKTNYAADRIILYIFRQCNIFNNQSDFRFTGEHSRIKFMFTEVFHRNKPLCESLQEEHLQLLFNKDAELIHSSVLIPIKQKDWYGLLVLGSRFQNQYAQSFEMDLLVYTAMICGYVVNNWFRPLIPH